MFDAHINAMEEAIRQATREYEQVESISRQLVSARTKLSQEYMEMIRMSEGDRKERGKVLHEKYLAAESAKL